MSIPILEMKNITKEFPGVKALDDVGFRVTKVKFIVSLVKMAPENQP